MAVFIVVTWAQMINDYVILNVIFWFSYTNIYNQLT